MKQTWQSLTEGERFLIYGAGALLLVFLLVFLVFNPLRSARDSADQFEADAERQFIEVSALARQAKSLRGNGSEAAGGRRLERDVSTRVLISRSARSAGITISRIQPNDNGALTLWIDSVASQSFYVWVRGLDEDYGLAPDNVSLQSQPSGTLRAQIQFPGVTN